MRGSDLVAPGTPLRLEVIKPLQQQYKTCHIHIHICVSIYTHKIIQFRAACPSLRPHQRVFSSGFPGLGSGQFGARAFTPPTYTSTCS